MPILNKFEFPESMNRFNNSLEFWERLFKKEIRFRKVQYNSAKESFGKTNKHPTLPL